MQWRPSQLLVAALVATAVLAPAPVWGRHHPDHVCSGAASIGGGGGEAGAECSTPSRRGRGPARGCDPKGREVAYYDDPPGEERSWTYARISLRDPPPEGMRWAAGYNCAGVYLGGPHLVADPEWGDIRAARDVAKTGVTPPPPTPNVSPSQAVAKFPTWLWVDDAYWQPATATVSQGAVTVRVQARPVRVTWDLEEGVRVCEGPGIPWSEQVQAAYEAQSEQTRGRGNPACTFTFVHSSTVTEDGVYHASVTVSWEFSWWLNGAAQGAFGTADRTTRFDLRVGEIQTLITEYY
ncbi:MAG: hypothetical protein M3O70_04480 [Actinomycetota bacterium]|nr:hypothetical protein [Actinomycetota bacterium]